jgi:hypothetical protein
MPGGSKKVHVPFAHVLPQPHTFPQAPQLLLSIWPLVSQPVVDEQSR